jgi:Uncharacterised protein family (UPF0236)
VTSVVTVFSPLDQTLQLGAQGWTPGTVAQAVRLAVEIPSYQRAAEVFRDLTHLPLSKSTLQRLTNQAGQQVAAQLEAEAQAMVRIPSPEDAVVWRQTPEPDSPMMNVSSDGVLIRLRDEGFKEVKTVAVSAVEQVTDAQTGETTVHLTHHSYRAGLWEAPTFANHLWAEACRRGVEKAKWVVSVNDGAAWIWAIVFMCFARCTQILDWYHATQRLWTIAATYFGDDQAAATAWVETQKALLAHSQLLQVLQNIRRLYPRGHSCPEPVTKAVRYLFHNRWRMRYREFRHAGCPLGSGVIESACKVVVQERMKQAGMQWSHSGAQAMLALRSILLSDRWALLNAAVRSL